MDNVVVRVHPQWLSVLELPQSHVAQIASATCVRNTVSQHQSVPYRGECTGSPSLRLSLTSIKLSLGFLERLTAEKAPEYPG